MTKARSNAVANAAKGDLTVGSGSNTSAILALGSDGQTLAADSTAATGLKWQADSVNTVINAAGDLLVGTANDTIGRLGIGSTGQVLTVAAGTASWATPSAGAPAWTRIANGTLSGASVSVSSINAAEILISLPGWSQGDSTAPFVRVNNDATNGNYGIQNNESLTGIRLWGSSTTGGNSFVYINGANTTAIMKFGLANLYPSFIKNSSAFTSVQILASGGSGTWSGGSYEVWTR